MKPAKETFGGVLRRDRGRARVSIQELAPRLGVNKNTLASYERGERLPDVDFLARFAVETDSDFFELLAARLVCSDEASARVYGEQLAKEGHRPAVDPKALARVEGMAEWIGLGRPDLAQTEVAERVSARQRLALALAHAHNRVVREGVMAIEDFDRREAAILEIVEQFLELSEALAEAHRSALAPPAPPTPAPIAKRRR